MVLTDCSILLVDDEKQISEINERLLSEDGFKNILRASNGKEADEIIGKNQVDLVVLDIMMPDISGLMLYEQWTKQGLNIPVIFLSARDEETSRLKGLGLGADDYVTKPFSPKVPRWHRYPHHHP